MNASASDEGPVRVRFLHSHRHNGELFAPAQIARFPRGDAELLIQLHAAEAAPEESTPAAPIHAEDPGEVPPDSEGG